MKDKKKEELPAFYQLSLKKVLITGDVFGKFGDFTIEQVFVNERPNPLEISYTFPITETATVTGFTVQAGEKIMHGVCKEKEEVKKELKSYQLMERAINQLESWIADKKESANKLTLVITVRSRGLPKHQYVLFSVYIVGTTVKPSSSIVRYCRTETYKKRDKGIQMYAEMNNM